MNRYEQRKIIQDTSGVAKNKFETRRKKYINRFALATFPNPENWYNTTKSIIYLWKRGDNYAKLAEEYYGDDSFWFIIAWYNKKYMDCDIKPGDQILIPEDIGFFEELLNV